MPQLQDAFRDIATSEKRRAQPLLENSTHDPVTHLDVLIIGAGFSGVYQLHTLRDAGFHAKIVEAGQGYGGVWYWNRYPGARVDIEEPYYQFADPSVWKDWEWRSRFPGSAEIREYFEHVADAWDIRRDTEFGAWVVGAKWDDVERRWVVRTRKVCQDIVGGNYQADSEAVENVYKTKWLLPCTGFAAKRYFPEWKGIEKFQGKVIHSSYWPQTNMEAGLYGRRIAVVGTGATAVQIIETFTPVASQLTVFQRTPNTALPMSQRTYNPPKDTIYPKSQLQSLFQKRTSSFTGQDYNFLPRKTFDDSPEERAGVYEGFWKEGNLKMWLGTYMDMLTNPEANDYAYNFWRDKTRPRIRDARVRDLLVPVEKPYAFGCKRIPLETTYFECFNKPHVELIDLNTTPIVEATETGLAVKTDEGGERNLDFDIIIFATGFDSVTGGLVQMNFVGANGRTLGEYWKDGVNNTLGVAIPGFPNMFFTYGPQAPTALWQGPACAEGTGEWIKRLLLEAKHLAVDKMEATEESAKAWRRTTDEIAAKTLLPETYSWYTGANIPGKVKQPLFFLGGAPEYLRLLNEALNRGLHEFDLWRGAGRLDKNVFA